jgi:hypothetical protein
MNKEYSLWYELINTCIKQNFKQIFKQRVTEQTSNKNFATISSRTIDFPSHNTIKPEADNLTAFVILILITMSLTAIARSPDG